MVTGRGAGAMPLFFVLLDDGGELRVQGVLLGVVVLLPDHGAGLEDDGELGHDFLPRGCW